MYQTNSYERVYILDSQCICGIPGCDLRHWPTGDGDEDVGKYIICLNS